MQVCNKVKPILIILFLTLLFACCTPKEEPLRKMPNSFALMVDSLIEVHGTIEQNQTLSDILLPHNVPAVKVNDIAVKAKEIFPVSSFRAGDEYMIYAKWDTTETVHYFVYIRNAIEYVVFDLRNDIKIYHGKKEVEIKEAVASGTIKSSLFETLASQKVDMDVAVKLAEIYAWQIDFFRIQPSDSFKVLYEQVFVEGKPAGVGRILASNFYHNKEDYYAFRFERGDKFGYYDLKGKSVRKAFLKAPLKFSRISSRYSKRRLHPLLGKVRAHLGTDYAAPYGTPIMSVGDGVVLEARYSGGNGNYVKIRHNSTYTTQYLHMSGFAKGIKPGRRVKQGEIIGYVGSTGLSTGPHVCYRFWKNGRQVDPLREKMPISESIGAEYRIQFDSLKMALLKKF